MLLTEFVRPAAKLGVKLVLASVTTIGELRAGSNDYDATLDSFQAAAKQVAAEASVPFVDLRKAYTEFEELVNSSARHQSTWPYTGILTYDGVHPATDGDKMLVDQHAGGLLAALASDGAAAAATATAFPRRVVVTPAATEVERYAAARLADLLALPIVDGGEDSLGDEATSSAQIAVGHGAALALGVKAGDLAALGDDAFLASTSHTRGVPVGSVAIASSATSARGTMNGAFAFLRELGFDFLSQDETVKPAGQPALPPDLDLLFDPPMESRDMAAVPLSGPGGQRAKTPPGKCNGWGPPGQGMMVQATNISAALGFNGHSAFSPLSAGGKPAMQGGYTGTCYNLLTASGTTFECGPGEQNASSRWLPCPRDAIEHPEWFACKDSKGTHLPYGNHVSEESTIWPCPSTGANSLVGPGKAHSQPCWSNASAIARQAASIRALMKKHPDTKLISLSGLDGTSTFIQCPTDVPFAIAANSTGGGNFYAANQIAKDLADDFPDLSIMILACEWPPSIQPSMQLCVQPPSLPPPPHSCTVQSHRDCWH